MIRMSSLSRTAVVLSAGTGASASAQLNAAAALEALRSAGVHIADGDPGRLCRERRWTAAFPMPAAASDEGEGWDDVLSFLPLCDDAVFSVDYPKTDEDDRRAMRKRRRLEEEAGELVAGEEDTWYYARNGLMAFLCVSIAALAAGLTMGLLSLDPLLLEIKRRAGSTKTERTQAANLLPLVRQHHRLLVTLLLLNSMSNEALPLFLDAIVPSYVAVILSVTLVLFFGEIIPSALFTGPNQLKMASKLAPLVRIVMALLCPLAYPIAKLLDVLLHDEDEEGGGMNQFNRGELSALVRIQYEERMAAKRRRRKEMSALSGKDKGGETTGHRSNRLQPPQHHIHAGTPYDVASSIRSYKREMSRRSIVAASGNGSHRPSALRRTPSFHLDEITMVEGALAMTTKCAMDVFTPLHSVFAVPNDLVLDEENVVSIYSSGYSRVPIFVPDDNADGYEGEVEGVIGSIVGVLMTKQLIVVNTADERCVSTLPLQRPFCVPPSINMVELINLFQTGDGAGQPGGGHLALVCARPRVAEEALNRGDPVPRAAAGVMGIVTLEDALEELLQEEIYDETDRAERAALRRAQWAYKRWRVFVKRRKLERERVAANSEFAGAPRMMTVALAVADAAGGNGPTSAESPLLGSHVDRPPSGSYGSSQSSLPPGLA